MDLDGSFLIDDEELIVDLFAGGGGASTGIEAALKRHVDIAVNHNPNAIKMHRKNHPRTRHYRADVWHVSPRLACAGRRVGLLWLSPACTHFSRASGGQNPKSAKIRSLASVAIRWAREVKPRIIFLENVEEFLDWGPLDNDGKPIDAKKGHSFNRWLGKLKAQGYAVEWRKLVAADYGAPTTRKRLFLIARRDGQPIVWPEATHGKGRAFAYRAASECIDWSLPCPSIFLTKDEGRAARVKRPLVEATLRRIAAGVMRYVINSPRPFIVSVHGGLIAPTLVQTGYGERPGQAPRTLNIRAPLGTVVAGGAKHALVSAFLAKHYGGVVGQPIDRPASTITTRDHHALVTVNTSGTRAAEVRAFLLKYYSGGAGPTKPARPQLSLFDTGTLGESQGQSLHDPLHTITTKARFALVTVEGVQYEIADIGMRMLAPHELWRAQGFDDPDVAGLDQTQQIELCGNSVCPPVAEALVRANYVARTTTRIGQQQDGYEGSNGT